MAEGDHNGKAPAADPPARQTNPLRLGETFAETVDSMDVAVWELDLDFRIVACNQKAVALYGENLIGTRCYDIAAHRESVCPDCAVADVFKGRDHGRAEHQRFAIAGAKRFIEHIVTPIHGRDKQVAGALVLIIDITQRKTIEDTLRWHQSHLESTVSQRTRELALSEEKYRHLMMQSSDCLLLHDFYGAIVEVNQCACDTYGYARAELLAMNVRDLDPDYVERENGGAFWKYLEKHQPKIFQARQKTKHGQILPMEVRLSLVDIGGKRLVLGFCRDISEQTRAEEERVRLEAQFHQAQKLESIGRLAGGVAHDLNNLLIPVLGYSEMLREDCHEESTAKEPLQEIYKAGLRARTLVHQLLAFSRKQAMAFKPVQINSVLGEFKNLLRGTLRENIAIRVRPAEHLPPINGDVGQLEQVIMNLAVNAQDAMPEGGDLTIETRLADLDDHDAQMHDGVVPGPHVVIIISDTGCGMNQTTKENLFEPFFTTKGNDVGTGLGMSTVYGIVKQHNGNIGVYSEPGVGTTFKVYLPVSKHTVAAEVEEQATPSDFSGTETILLVEDNEQVRKLSRTILSRHGYCVIEAKNGQDALESVKQDAVPIHLLLTDVIMPDMNGKQLSEQIKTVFPKVRVLYMSGYTDNVIAHHGVIDTGVEFIAKPFSNDALLAKIREVLDGG